jgi:hypothetical protein
VVGSGNNVQELTSPSRAWTGVESSRTFTVDIHAPAHGFSYPGMEDQKSVRSVEPEILEDRSAD